MDNSNFLSLDKLVEFGLGMNIANQMIQQMNQGIQNMQMPAQMPMPNTQDSLYVVLDGKSTGPLSNSQFKELVSKQMVNKDTLVWIPGMPDWKPIEQVPAALKLIAMTPPPVPNV